VGDPPQRLAGRRPGCRLGDPAVPSSGRQLKRDIVPPSLHEYDPRGGSHNPHPTARIHWHARQRGSRVVACGARAAHHHHAAGSGG
jgi:hypothetical protein